MASTLGLVSLACLGGATALTARWIPRRYDALGRLQSFPVVGVCLLLVLAVGSAIPTAHRRMQQHRLATVAGQLAGRPVRVRCQTTTGELLDAGSELGYVPFGPDGRLLAQTVIKHQQCKDLASYTGGDQEHPTAAEVVAVHVLTHESMHMRGESSEAVAECEAVQRDALTARLLGASSAAASRLARSYLLAVYPRMPDAYVTLDCRPGGPLDEHLDPSVFSPAVPEGVGR